MKLSTFLSENEIKTLTKVNSEDNQQSSGMPAWYEKEKRNSLSLQAATKEKKKLQDKKISHAIRTMKEDEVDTVTLDIPLLLRIMEYAREDAREDMDLHDVAEKMIELSKSHEYLCMDNYDEIIGNVNEAEPVPGKYSGHFYDATILPTGDYKVVKINSKKDSNGQSNPLGLNVGDVVPKGKAHQLQYQSDGGMFDELRGVSEAGMPSSVIKHKQRMAEYTPEQLLASFKNVAERFGKATPDMIEKLAREMAWRHGYGRMSDHYWKQISHLVSNDVNESEKQKGLDGKACWDGYKRMGTKMKGGKRVDNCVPIKKGK